jgi:hypothetical protein
VLIYRGELTGCLTRVGVFDWCEEGVCGVGHVPGRDFVGIHVRSTPQFMYYKAKVVATPRTIINLASITQQIWVMDGEIGSGSIVLLGVRRLRGNAIDISDDGLLIRVPTWVFVVGGIKDVVIR